MSIGIFSVPADFFVWYAAQFLKTPYHWGYTVKDGEVISHGGDDFAGMDCSGFISECLQAVGIAKNRDRRTADQWFRYFEQLAADNPGPGRFPADAGVVGSLQFFQDPQGHCYHVNICIGNDLVIGAIGGDSKTVTDEDAASRNAFIKVRPFNYRKPPKNHRIVYVNPFVICGMAQWSGLSYYRIGE